jgi:hypothetical protein
MPRPVGFQRLPGMNGVQFSPRNVAGTTIVEPGTCYATDEYVGGGESQSTQTPEPWELAKAVETDISQLRERGEKLVLARLARDLGQYSDPADKLKYLRSIPKSGPLYERHYIFMQIDEAIEAFTNGDTFMSLGSTFDTACINEMLAYRVEMEHSESLSPEDREKIADMLYVNARRNLVQYRVYEAAMLALLDVIHRYKTLDLTDKVHMAEEMVKLIQREAKSKIDDMERASMMKKHFGDPDSLAETLINGWANWGRMQLERVLIVGYERAAELLNTFADAFDRFEGAERKAAIYREKADEYRRIGTELGLIEA